MAHDTGPRGANIIVEWHTTQDHMEHTSYDTTPLNLVDVDDW